MSSPGRGSIGALDYTPDERRTLAKKSQSWACDVCGPIQHLLSGESSKPATKDEQELVKCIDMKAEEHTVNAPSEPPVTEEAPPVNASPNNQTPIIAEPRIRINHIAPQRFGRLGDILLGVLVAAIALLITRRMVLTMFL